MERKNMLWVAMILVVAIFLAGCAGPPVQYRHEENFLSPNGKGVTQIGAMGDITRDGTFEKGFIRYCPFDEGNIRTLKDEIEVVENYPDLEPGCNNYRGQLKKGKKVIYRHQYVVEGRIVHTWDTDQPNWWAVGFANLGRELISRGIDAAVLLAAPEVGAINVAGGAVGDITQQQKSVNKNKNTLKNKNTTKVNTKVNTSSKSISGAKAKVTD
jgi:hypothetical protein